MKRKLLVILGCLSLVLIMLACSQPAPGAAPAPAPAPAPTQAQPPKPAELITLKMHSYQTPTDPISGYVPQWWVDQVNKRAAGKMKIDIYWSQALGKAPDMLDMLDKHICDIGFGAYPHFPGRFPVTDVVGLPYLCTSTGAVAQLLNEMYYEGMLKEYNNYKVIAFLPTDPNLMFFRNTPITTLEQIKGKKMRGPGQATLDMIEALGATPTSIVTTELYSSLDRGIIDGLVTSLGYFYPNKVYEVAKYMVGEPMIGGMNFVLMNQNVWNSLSPELQNIISETSTAFTFYHIAKQNDQYANDTLPGVQKAGVKVLTLTDAELDKWHKATQPLVDKWIAATEAKGLPGKQAVAKARTIQLANQ